MNNNGVSRFVVQSQHKGTVILDRALVSKDLIVIYEPLLDAAVKVVSVVNWRDPDAYVEVYSMGLGLAMAGLLRAYGLNVVQAHVWDWVFEDEEEDEEEDED